MSYAHLHAHTEYTLTDGSMRIDEYLDRVEELGIPSAAVTDTHNLFGAFKFHEKALGRGIKPIIGVDLRVSDEVRTAVTGGMSTKRMRVFIQNRAGYRRLSHLISESYRRRSEGELFVPLEELSDKKEGLLFVGPPGRSAERQPRNWEQKTAEDAVGQSLDRFGDRFFVEVPLYQSQLQNVESLVLAAQNVDVTILPTRPSYFTEPGMEERLRIRRAIQKNMSLDDSPTLPSHRSQQYIPDPAALETFASELELSLENTKMFADQCYFEFETDQIRIPTYPFGEMTSNELLEDKCRSAIEQREFDVSDEEVNRRVARELDVIQTMGFADYFLIVADIVNWARENGIRVGPGRGSAAGSLVAYLLDVTTVDPFKFDLIFERFLNPQRNEMPDIDIDFADDRRGEVIEYIRKRFGEASVAHIITFGKMKARNSIRDVGRIRGEPQERIDQFAETMPSGTNDSLRRLRNHIDAFGDKIESNAELERWFQQAGQIEGLVRNASVHAAGILIAEDRLDHEIPLYYSDEDEAMPASQFDMYDVEKLGFLKLDILGLKTLSLIERTLEHIPSSECPDIDNLPDSDQDTFDFLMNGSLEGIFQFESAGSRELVRNMEPDSRQDIVDCIALYRPGPMEIRDDYLKRRENPERVDYPHEDLKPILEDTYGLILYQEQVMAIARKVGDFTWSEADTLRKAMGKKRADLMETMRQDFVNGALENGYEENWAREIFETLSRFAEYGFNRSHSAAYGEITYMTAYLKAHFTPEFYAALLSIKSHDRDRVKRIIEGMREDAVGLRSPSINDSGADFSVEDGEVRFGLKAIKHVGSGFARAIEEARGESRYDDVEDFVSRIKPRLLRTQNFQALVAAGCFDDLNGNRGWLIDHADELIERGQTRYEERSAGQSNMFGEESKTLSRPANERDTWNKKQRIRAQKKVLGFIPHDDVSGSRPSSGVAWYEFTFPGTIEKFGEFMSTDTDSLIARPQVVARVEGIMNEGEERLLRLSGEHDEIMVRCEESLTAPEPENGEFLVEFRPDDSEWIASRIYGVADMSEVGLEIHLSENQDLNQLRRLKEIFEQIPGKTPLRLILHGQNRGLDLNQTVECSRALKERVDGILGKHHMRLYRYDDG